MDFHTLHGLRFDNVGSLIRPLSLRRAWKEFNAGRCDRSRLESVMAHAVRDAIGEQEKRGYPVLVDGELRRRIFTETFQEVQGFEDWADRYVRAVQHVENNEGATSAKWEAPSAVVQVPATRRLALLRNRPLQEYAAAQALTSRPVKATLIGPDRIFQTYDRDSSRAVYPEPHEFLDDVVRVEHDIVAGLESAGCRYIQMDAPGFTAYVDPVSLDRFEVRGIDPIETMRMTIRAENEIVRRFPDVVFGIHICRGNQNGHWHREGGYDAIAEELFGKLEHQRLLLEYDSERAGSFAPLRYVPKDKIVVLGLITTKSPLLEDKDMLMRRIEEASGYLGVEQLALSPQCGFGSGIDATVMSEDDQWRKLDLCLEVVEEVWQTRTPLASGG